MARSKGKIPPSPRVGEGPGVGESYRRHQGAPAQYRRDIALQRLVSATPIPVASLGDPLRIPTRRAVVRGSWPIGQGGMPRSS